MSEPDQYPAPVPPGGDAPAPRPAGLRMAIVIVWVQVVANVLVGLLSLVVVADATSDAAEHGTEVDGLGLTVVSLVVTLVVVVGLAVGAVLAGRGDNRGRITVIALEALAIVSSIITLIAGSIPGLLGMVLGVVVIANLSKREVATWFANQGH